MPTLLRLSRMRALISSLFALGVFFTLGVTSALADNTYTVAGADNAALPNVGAASVTLNAITLTDTGGGDFGDTEAISITINAAQYPNVKFDTSVATVTIGGTVLSAGTPAVVYTNGNATATITLLTGGGVSANGETITITGLKIGTIYAATAPGAAPLLGVDNSTSSIGSPVNSPNVNLATLTGALSATSMTPDSYASNSLTTYTVAMTGSAISGSSALASGSKIQVTFPSGFDVSAVNGTTAQNLSGITGTWTASVSGQVVTLTQSGGSATAAGPISFKLINVRNTQAAGTTGTFTLLTQTSANASVQIANPAGVSISTASNNAASFDAITNVSVEDYEGGVMLSWDESTDDDATYIQILRGVDPLPVSGTVYTTVATGVGYYIDTDVEEGDVVTYQLRPTDGVDTGDLTTAVTFTVGSDEDSSDDSTDDSTDDTVTDDTTDDSTDDTTDDTTDDEGTTDDDMEEEDDIVAVVSSFSDTENHWAMEEIEVMVEAGVVEGNPDGSFDPDGNLNRAEAAALLWRVLMMGEPSDATEDPFSDVSMMEWYAAYIAGLKSLELVEGNPDGTYEPSEEINRAEFLQLAVNVYEYLDHSDVGYDYDYEMVLDEAYEDVDSSAWYAGTVAWATYLGYVQGSECEGGMCFNAGASITRAEATKILYNMFSDML